MDNESLSKLKLLEKNILLDVSEICKKNGLKYYLVGGTLIGAIRHKGFIPWDDDIDIAMFRKDYELLFNLLLQDKLFLKKYFIQRFETDKNYTRYIMKIRLKGTKHIEHVNKKIKQNQGIYIDIFPLDYISEDRTDIVKRSKKMKRLFALKNIKHGSVFYTSIKRIAGKILRCFLLFIPDKWLNLQFKKVCEKDNIICNKFVTSFASHYSWEKQKFPASYYGDGVEVEFEGEKFIAPVQYDKILTQLFGDYMKIPPKEEQEQHNIIEVDFGSY